MPRPFEPAICGQRAGAWEFRAWKSTGAVEGVFAMGLADFIKVYRFLRGIRYPATKQQLVDQARSNQADEEALSSLREMPEGEYSGPDDVSRVIAER